MSDTPIHEYYPENKPAEAPPSLVAGEAITPPTGASIPMSDATSEVTPTEATDLGIDLPDIPLPDDEPLEDGVKDEFNDAAFNFAIVGVGQGGSRLAESFWNLGYRRVGIINTAQQDLSLIKIPEENKLLVGDGGAGDSARHAWAHGHEEHHGVQ